LAGADTVVRRLIWYGVTRLCQRMAQTSRAG
jgi:hypothetical protein